MIVDSAPVLRVADALELMTTADLVLMVARRGVSHMRPIAATVERISQAGGSVSGSVLNDIDSRASGYTYGYHGPVTRTVPAAPKAPPAGTVSPQPVSDAGLGILQWSKRGNGDDVDYEHDTEEALNEDADAVVLGSDGGEMTDEYAVHDSDADGIGQDRDEGDGVDAPDSPARAPAEPRPASSPNGRRTGAGRNSDRESDQASHQGDNDAHQEQPERTVDAGLSSWSGAGHASQGKSRRRRPRR